MPKLHIKSQKQRRQGWPRKISMKLYRSSKRFDVSITQTMYYTIRIMDQNCGVRNPQMTAASELIGSTVMSLATLINNDY